MKIKKPKKKMIKMDGCFQLLNKNKNQTIKFQLQEKTP